jgi:RHS repeat-associated protein
MVSAGNSYYAYDSSNLRVYSRNASGAETVYFYGADGTKLVTYTYAIVTVNGNPEIQLTQQSENVYFLGKLVSAEGTPVTTDRLGPVHAWNGSARTQYPYGVEYSVTANDREKYATYTRDSVTGLDYAMNRYYASQWGRFLSPDPYQASNGGAGDRKNPQSWNRYMYTQGDPANNTDRHGLYLDAQQCIADPDSCNAQDWGFGGLVTAFGWPALNDSLWGNPGDECDSGTGPIYGFVAPPDGPSPCSPPPACIDSLAMFTRRVGGVAGRLGGSHSYLDIDSADGELLDTVEGDGEIIGGSKMLVGLVSPNSTGLPLNNPSADYNNGGHFTVTCAGADNIVRDAEGFKPVPYTWYAGSCCTSHVRVPLRNDG